MYTYMYMYSAIGNSLHGGIKCNPDHISVNGGNWNCIQELVT